MFAHVLASARMLKEQQDWELDWEGVSGAGWRALQHECGLRYQKPCDEEKKTFFLPLFPPHLGKLQVMICLPRSMLAFFLLPVCFLGEGKSIRYK